MDRLARVHHGEAEGAQRRLRPGESYGGYTTDLPLEDLVDGKAWVAFRYDGEDMEAEHCGPARLLDQDEPGFWQSLGYHSYGDPWHEQRYWGD